MATVVLDVELHNCPPEITGLHEYKKAFLLCRYKGKPVGTLTIPINNSCIYIKNIQQDIFDAVESNLWSSWLHDFLDWDERQITNYVPPKATVAVCTRNRTNDLRRCLDALMQLPDDDQEFLVIDNCPFTDETQKLVALYGKVRYVREDRPGLDFARNRAFLEARNEVVAFTDDDALPDPGWLRAILCNFANPMVMCVTGLTLPLELETEAQEAFESYSPFSKGFKRITHTSTSRNPLSTGAVGAGANMALRKTVVSKVALFDEALDAGTPTQSGGDHEFFARILLAGYHIIYEPAALSWHRHRRTWQETRKAIKGYGVGVYAFWTRMLIVEHEVGVLQLAWQWFIHNQVPNLLRALLRRPNSKPLQLLLDELSGCFVGPWAYLKAIRQLKTK